MPNFGVSAKLSHLKAVVNLVLDNFFIQGSVVHVDLDQILGDPFFINSIGPRCQTLICFRELVRKGFCRTISSIRRGSGVLN